MTKSMHIRKLAVGLDEHMDRGADRVRGPGGRYGNGSHRRWVQRGPLFQPCLDCRADYLVTIRSG